MDLDRPLLPPHPLDAVGRRIAALGDGSEASWNAASTRMIALAILVLQHMNPRATERQVLSYVRHSTLRELLDEAIILDPELAARIMRDPWRGLTSDATWGARREDRERRRPRLIDASRGHAPIKQAPKGGPMIAPRRQPRADGSASLSLVPPVLGAGARMNEDGGGTLGDEDLLDRIRDRDTTAFELFYDRHCRIAYWLACHILGETEAACAAVEEAFIQVWREPIRHGHPRETARASLLSRVNRCALDALRYSATPRPR